MAKVQVSLDGITYQDATLAAPNATSTTYTTTITPKGGANVPRARALDQKGNISLLITRNFTHLRTLTVAISGPLNSGTVSKVPAEYVKSYTARFKPRDSQGEGFTSKDYPQGNGYLTFSVANNGVVTMVGKLADDVPVSMSGNLSQFNQWPIFQSLHSNRGCIAANAVLDDSQPDTDATAMDMLWFCPALNMQWYPHGWSEGIFVDMLASKYTPPPASVFPGLPASNPTYGNTDLIFTQGLLTGTIVKRVNMTPANVATRAPVSDTSVSFIPTFTSGLISGLFRHTDNTMTKWQGVLMQKGANRGGHGYFLSTRPSITDFKGESGAMSWRVVRQ